MNKEFKASHFDNIEELLKHCDMWIKDEDYDAYCRWFDMGAMEELINHITNLKQALNGIREYCNNPFNWKYTDHYLEKEDILEIIDKVLGEDINEN